MKAITSLSRILNMISSCILAAMMLLTTSDVCMRFFFNRPITGATELTQDMMVYLSFLGLAWCAATKSHLKVDLIMDHLPPRVQAVIDALTVLAGLCVAALISWQNIVEALVMQKMKITSSLLKLPVYPNYYIVALGCALLCLVMVAIMIQKLGAAFKK